jgi:ligand-binding sensor domain-containing protein
MRLQLFAKYCAVFILSIFSLVLHAQQIKTRYLGIENGLSNNAVCSIFQDHNGFMWFGTYDGLSRYDGYSFKTFSNIIGDSTSIGSNNINAIDEDASHFLWIGGQKGLNVYNPVTSKLFRPSLNRFQKASAQSLNDNVLTIKVVSGAGSKY